MKSKLTMIKDLEKHYSNDPLIVLAELPNSKDFGQKTLADFLVHGNFVKVVSVSSLKDLDKILENIAKNAVIDLGGLEEVDGDQIDNNLI